MEAPVHESDWKLFRKRVPGWQEAYMGKLVEAYMALLSGEGKASEKFWELDRRIRRHRKEIGVIIDMRRSLMYNNLMQLLSDGVITLDDLDGFSDDVTERMAFLYNSFGH